MGQLGATIIPGCTGGSGLVRPANTRWLEVVKRTDSTAGARQAQRTQRSRHSERKRNAVCGWHSVSRLTHPLGSAASGEPRPR